MMVEGIGLQAPAPIRVRLPPEIRHLLMRIADERMRYRRYAVRRDAWGRGFTKNPILVGLGGEWAVADFLTRHGFPCQIDQVLRPHGDGGVDLTVRGLTMDVKTRRAKCSYVARGDQSGRILPLIAEAFVFGEWNETVPDADPLLLGWLWATAVRRGRFERSIIHASRHFNLRVPDRELLPMSRLLDDLSARPGR